MASTYRFTTLLLLLTLPACEPKDDGSDDTGAEAGGTTTGDEVTTSGDASDPTAPSTDPSASGTSATGGSSATSTSTTSGDPTVGTSAEDTGGSGMTTVGTSTTTAATTDPGDTSDTDFPPPVDPPPPCEGQATPLVGITTTMGYLQSQVPPRQDPTGGSTTTTGGGDLDPGTLFVKLSDQNFTCADPNALLACGAHWEVTIVIPPEFQSPGVHNLLGQNVRGTAIETGPEEGMDCGFGGGSFGATFEILAIDDKVVEGRLCNVDSFFSFTNPQLEGSFTADRCPQ